MEVRKDILGQTPEIGDTIIFNPPRYKGLVHGTCIGFKQGSGLPMVTDLSSMHHYWDSTVIDGLEVRYATPKTGFVAFKPTENA